MADERKQRQYVRRHQEASHDAAAWLWITLLRVRWERLQQGPEIGIWPDIRLSFQDIRMRNIFRRAGAITPDQIESLPPEYAAVCHILLARCGGEQFSRSDLNILTTSLNWPLQLRASDDHRILFQNKMESRRAAELLMEYMDSLIWSHVPQAIGVCESCRGLFLRIKANQVACSDSCRFQSLKEQNYWSPLSREIRRQRHEKANARKVKIGRKR